MIRIKDNSQISKDGLKDIPNLRDRIVDKTLEQLEKEGIFVFPELLSDANDITREQMILQTTNDGYFSTNVMGFIGLGNEKLVISSRFSSGEQDFLFQYLLERLFDVPNIVDLQIDADKNERIFNLLVFIFPYYLRNAMRKGVFKTYVRNRYNDSNVKGIVDIVRHIAKNTPFVGNIAYSQREYSYDNYLMELVRHTIEFIKRKSYGYKILSRVRDEVKTVIAVTSSYEVYDMQRIVNINRKNVIRHAFYKEYGELQRLCMLILEHQKHQIGFGNKQIYGILFDGAYLWEEYVNSIVSDVFYHPMNKGGNGSQRLFDNNQGLIYPDFISKNAENRVIADAKYKPIDNIGNRDYLQVLAYMFRFDAKVGIYLYPEKDFVEDMVMHMNSGSTYEDNVKPRSDIYLVKHGFKIPAGAKDYQQFVAAMKQSEKAFKEEISKHMAQGVS